MCAEYNTTMWIKVTVWCLLAGLCFAVDGNTKKEKRNLEYSISHTYPQSNNNYRSERRISNVAPPRYPQYFPGRPYTYFRKGKPQSPPPYAVQMEPLVHYSQRDPLYDPSTLHLLPQPHNELTKPDDLLGDNNHLSEHVYGPPKHYIERPIYIKEPEPIIEIIIKEANTTAAPPLLPVLPLKKKKEEVQVFYVKYKKNPNGSGKDSVIYDKPIPAINKVQGESAEEEHQSEYLAPEIPVTYAPPVATTIRAIIKPDSETYHANSGIHITFGGPSHNPEAEKYSHDDEIVESAPQPAVAHPQGRRFPEFNNKGTFQSVAQEYRPEQRLPQPYKPFTFNQPSANSARFTQQQSFSRPHSQPPPPSFQQQFPQSFQSHNANPSFNQQPAPTFPTKSAPPQFQQQSFQNHQSSRYQSFDQRPPQTSSFQFPRPQTHFPIQQQPPVNQPPPTFNPQFSLRPNNNNRPPQQHFQHHQHQGSQQLSGNHQQSLATHHQQQSSGNHQLQQSSGNQHLQQSPGNQHQSTGNQHLQQSSGNQHLQQSSGNQHLQQPSINHQQQSSINHYQQSSFNHHQQPPNRQQQINRPPQQNQQQIPPQRIVHHQISHNQQNYQNLPQQQQNQQFQQFPQQQQQQNQFRQQQFNLNNLNNIPHAEHIIPPGGELIQSLPKFEQHISIPPSGPPTSEQEHLSPQEFTHKIQQQFRSITSEGQEQNQQSVATSYAKITGHGSHPSHPVTSAPFVYQTTPRPTTTRRMYYSSTSASTTPRPTTTSTTTTPQPESTTTDLKALNIQLPDEVPDDLREQLLSSGILKNAQISVLDYDKVGDIPISALPPDQLANFYAGGGAQQISASEPKPSVLKLDGTPVTDQEMEVSASEVDEVKVKQPVEMKVVHYDPQTQQGQDVHDAYIKEGATQVEPVVLNDQTYNRYLPLKVSGAQFPIPDVPELKGKDINSVVVLAPVDYKFAGGHRVARKANQVDNELKFVRNEALKDLLKNPTGENYKRFLERENSTSSDKQSVILLVTGSAKEREIFMYDVATQSVSKLDGELSAAFVDAAETNATPKGDISAASSNLVETKVPPPEGLNVVGASPLDDIELDGAASDIFESRVPIIDPMQTDLEADGSEQFESFVDVSGLPVEPHEDLSPAASDDNHVYISSGYSKTEYQMPSN